MIPESVAAWLEENGYGGVVGSHAAGGGCISNGMHLKTGRGDRFFLKVNARAPDDMFVRESEGLRALAAAQGGPRVPEPLLAGESFLLLEDLAPAPRAPDYWEGLGRQLARLHQHADRRYGFPHDNYIGSTPQPNPWTDNGHRFFARQRLQFQADLARQRGLLDAKEHGMVERLSARLPELVPEQPASLIHGDLWSGNALADSQGQPALIDPAAHYGWAEAELAMTALFGGFPRVFYSAYESARPLEPGYRDRFPIYNLYHLLNHLNLFGRSYHAQVKGILRRFA